jgi:uncharacterized protein (DUF58 family)
MVFDDLWQALINTIASTIDASWGLVAIVIAIFLVILVISWIVKSFTGFFTTRRSYKKGRLSY